MVKKTKTRKQYRRKTEKKGGVHPQVMEQFCRQKGLPDLVEEKLGELSGKTPTEIFNTWQKIVLKRFPDTFTDKRGTTGSSVYFEYKIINGKDDQAYEDWNHWSSKTSENFEKKLTCFSSLGNGW